VEPPFSLLEPCPLMAYPPTVLPLTVPAFTASRRDSRFAQERRPLFLPFSPTFKLTHKTRTFAVGVFWENVLECSSILCVMSGKRNE
jgi:hypothetical protein